MIAIQATIVALLSAFTLLFHDGLTSTSNRSSSSRIAGHLINLPTSDDLPQTPKCEIDIVYQWMHCDDCPAHLYRI